MRPEIARLIAQRVEQGLSEHVIDEAALSQIAAVIGQNAPARALRKGVVT